MEYVDYQFDHGYTRFIYERRLLIDHGITFPDYLRYQDPPFMVRAMLAAGKFYAVTDVTYAYRNIPKELSITKRKVNDFMSGLRDVMQIAAVHELNMLLDISISRLNHTFSSIVAQNITVDNPEVLVLLMEMNGIVARKTGYPLAPVKALFLTLQKAFSKQEKRARIMYRIGLLMHPKTLLRTLAKKHATKRPKTQESVIA